MPYRYKTFYVAVYRRMSDGRKLWLAGLGVPPDEIWFPEEEKEEILHHCVLLGYARGGLPRPVTRKEFEQLVESAEFLELVKEVARKIELVEGESSATGY